jgi:hypothetical protein
MRSLHGRILQLVADQSERVLGNGSEAASAVTIAPSNWNARWLGQKPLDDADLAPRGQGRLPTVGWFPELLLSDAEPSERRAYSGTATPEPPSSAGKSLSLGIVRKDGCGPAIQNQVSS